MTNRIDEPYRLMIRDLGFQLQGFMFDSQCCHRYLSLKQESHGDCNLDSLVEFSFQDSRASKIHKSPFILSE